MTPVKEMNSGRRDGSLVKNKGVCRGLRFRFQQLTIIPNSSFRGSSTLKYLPWGQGIYVIHIHVSKTLIYIKLIFNLRE